MFIKFSLDNCQKTTHPTQSKYQKWRVHRKTHQTYAIKKAQGHHVLLKLTLGIICYLLKYTTDAHADTPSHDVVYDFEEINPSFLCCFSTQISPSVPKLTCKDDIKYYTESTKNLNQFSKHNPLLKKRSSRIAPTESILTAESTEKSTIAIKKMVSWSPSVIDKPATQHTRDTKSLKSRKPAPVSKNPQLKDKITLSHETISHNENHHHTPPHHPSKNRGLARFALCFLKLTEHLFR